MVFQALINLCLGVLMGFFDLLNVFQLPFEAINVLGEILVYGSWVVGVDMLILIFSSVFMWVGVRFSFNILLWVYEHIPFIQ